MAASRSGRHGGSPQSWPCWLNASGGAPIRTPSASTSCSAQPSAPSRVAADGQVVHHPHADRPGRVPDRRQLLLHLPLQPGVEGHPRGELAGAPAHAGRRRVRAARPASGSTGSP